MPPSVGQKPLPFALPRLNKGLAPEVAWPTVLLAAIFCSLSIASIYASTSNHELVIIDPSSNSSKQFSLQMRDGFWNHRAFWVAFFIRALACYVLFTPMHDASHGSVGRRSFLWLNDLVGVASGVFVSAPFPLFCRIHLEHHKYVNAPVDADLNGDPDLATGGGWNENDYRALPPGLRHLLLLFRSAALPLYYLYHVAAHDIFGPSKMRVSIGVIARDLTIYTLLILFPIFVAPFTTFNYCFFLWAAPNFCAFAFLGCFFDYFPHRPHDSTEAIRATSLVTLFSCKEGKKLTEADIFEKGGSHFLTAPLLSQNYHVVHHMMQSVPWYLYSTALFETDLFENMAAAKPGLRAYGLLPVFVF